MYGVRPLPTDIAKYSIELFKPGGEDAGIEEILDRHADLRVARSIYRGQRGEVSRAPDYALRWRSSAGPKRSAENYPVEVRFYRQPKIAYSADETFRVQKPTMAG